jgi:HTH-type transcriptional regulator/antitoxin HigA
MWNNPQPGLVLPPGETVSDELEARGWTQQDLAAIMARPVQLVNEVINGRKAITPETAHGLAAAFSTSPQFWLNLEASYRLFVARQQHQSHETARRSRLFELLPIRELQKRGWLAPTERLDELEEQACALLGVSSPSETPVVAAALRQSPTADAPASFLVAWLHMVRTMAGRLAAGSFDRQRLEQQGIAELMDRAADLADVAQVPSLLARYGVKLVVLKHLPRTRLDGAVTLLDPQPVVAVTLRYDRVDNFWFTLLHELAHVVMGHDGTRLEDLDQSGADASEREADRLAQDWLIPPRAWQRLCAAPRQDLTFRTVRRFAAEIKRHPGIVVGRLQHEDILGYQQMRRALERVSPFLPETPLPGDA